MSIFGLFKKKDKNVKKEIEILAPVTGELLNISEVPDEAFSQKMMGDGFAVKSCDGIVVSPVDAEVQLVFETKHAIGLKTDAGLEMLIHFGIDTVNLKGEGFDVLVKAGDKVKAGQELMKVDVDFIKANAASDITPVIFTNLEEGKSVDIILGDIVAGEKGRIKLV